METMMAIVRATRLAVRNEGQLDHYQFYSYPEAHENRNTWKPGADPASALTALHPAAKGGHHCRGDRGGVREVGMTVKSCGRDPPPRAEEEVGLPEGKKEAGP